MIKRNIYSILRNRFGLSHREIKGFAIVIIILILYLFIVIGLHIYKSSKTFSYDSQRKQDLENLVTLMDSLKKANNLKKMNTVLFQFNPNIISSEEWQALGLKKYLAERIIKYRGKGGKFYKKEDLKKIYGFPSNLYKRLHPYIDIPKEKLDKKKN